MRRREFITLLGGAASAWPLAAHAQQAGLPVIGFLSSRSSNDSALQIAVIFAGGPAAHVAKAATTTIPIVFVSGEDPVEFGLVASLNRPGDNITGVSTFNAVVGSKRFELLHELVPNAAVIALLVNPKYPSAGSETRETQAAARAIGLNLIILNASTESEIDAAFATLVQQRIGALVVTGDPFFVSR